MIFFTIMNIMNFTNTDYFATIAMHLNGYSDYKKLSEINKFSNDFVNRETNLRDIVKEKRDKYNCDMLENYLIKKIRCELDNNARSGVNYKIHIAKYMNMMNKDCLPYLEDIISYYFQEKNRRDHGLNNYTQKISISVSKILYNIILSFDNNYRLKNKNIELWIL